MTSYQKLKAKIEALEKESQQLRRECVILTFQDKPEETGATFMEITSIKQKWMFVLNNEKAIFAGNSEKRSQFFEELVSMKFDDHKK
jgi:hypothetical protein